LRAGEQRALRKIETSLAKSDPWLRSQFTMFARLHPDTVAWGPEDLGARPAPRTGRRTRSRIRGGTSPARLTLFLFMSVALLTVTCAMFLGGNPGAPPCRPAAQPQSAASTTIGWPVPMGHRLVVPGTPVRAAASFTASCQAGSSELGQLPITQP
jgi:hypothetical protein